MEDDIVRRATESPLKGEDSQGSVENQDMDNGNLQNTGKTLNTNMSSIINY